MTDRAGVFLVYSMTAGQLMWLYMRRRRERPTARFESTVGDSKNRREDELHTRSENHAKTPST